MLVEDPNVSRLHCRISPRPGSNWVYFLEDLQSANGTSLNGKPVEQPTRIRPDDVIRIGTSRILVQAPMDNTADGLKAIALTRLERWEGSVGPECFDGLARAIDKARDAPEDSLAWSRRTLEHVVREVFQQRIGRAKRRDRLNEWLDRLERQELMPAKILALCRAVQHLGNVGVHPIFDDERELSHREAHIAVAALTIVLEWHGRACATDNSPDLSGEGTVEDAEATSEPAMPKVAGQVKDVETELALEAPTPASSPPEVEFILDVETPPPPLQWDLACEGEEDTEPLQAP